MSSISRFRTRKSRIIRLIIESVLLLAILLLSPEEATLGNLIKAVFLHGAFMGIAQVFMIVSAVFGIAYLARNGERTARRLWSFELAAYLFVLASFVLSLWLMEVSWGSIDIAEPRFQAVLRILILSAAAAGLTFLFQKARIAAVSGIVIAAYTSFEFATARMIMHPADPIWTSASIAVKFSYSATLILLLVIGLEAVDILAASKLMRAVAPSQPELMPE